MLVEAGADVNAREPLRGTTALMWAARQKHPEAVKVLLAAGADVGEVGWRRCCRATTWPSASTRVSSMQAHERRRARGAAGRTYDEQFEFEQTQNA